MFYVSINQLKKCGLLVFAPQCVMYMLSSVKIKRGVIEYRLIIFGAISPPEKYSNVHVAACDVMLRLLIQAEYVFHTLLMILLMITYVIRFF